tara:strand:+ start:217 stop:417 length:201 start_codon:yes stop_codon:yes gene_type:complete
MYKVFTRTWWKKNTSDGWPNGLEPHMGRRRILTTVHSEEEARRICKQWNAENPEGLLSRRAEYMDA